MIQIPPDVQSQNYINGGSSRACGYGYMKGDFAFEYPGVCKTQRISLVPTPPRMEIHPTHQLAGKAGAGISFFDKSRNGATNFGLVDIEISEKVYRT